MEANTNFYIVGLGASAGGFEALIDFFSHLPEKTQAAFVIVRHLLRDSPTCQEQLLSKHTRMKVLRAENGQQVCPDHVYMLPENGTLTMRNGKLYLHPRNQEKINRAVDIFFTSLAADQKHRAIGIILSGLGSDGVDGANALHAHGGMVMVQQPESAQFKGMPETAIAGDDPDAILPPEKLAQMLMTHLKVAPALVSLPEEKEKYARAGFRATT